MPYDARSGADGPFFDGRFSDGRTAAASDVRAAFSERGLVLHVRGTEEPLIWPYGALTTAEPISSHAIDALVAYKYQPGASLFVPSGLFARRLAEAAPHLTTRASRRRAAAPWLWAAAAVIAIAVAVSLLQLSPARTVAGLMPEGVRQTLGEHTIKSMTAGKAECKTPAGRLAVDRLSQRLTAAAPEGARFHVTVVDWELVNAFAAPGNRIVLTRGLIAKAGGPDEVAGVLAHEMGHGIGLHPETGIVRAIGLSAALELMLGGGGGTLSNVGLLLAQLSYTRVAEAEADEHGLALLKGAGVSPNGIRDFFRRMEARSKELDDGRDGRSKDTEPGADGKKANSTDRRRGGGLADMLSTHPATQDRIRRIEAADKYPSTPALSAADWTAMKAMCGPAQPGDESEQ